jgi:hypothetical protein
MSGRARDRMARKAGHNPRTSAARGNILADRSIDVRARRRLVANRLTCAVDGQQHYRCHGYPKPPPPRFLRSGRTLVKVTTSPPMSGSHRIAAAAAFQNEYDLI